MFSLPHSLYLISLFHTLIQANAAGKEWNGWLIFDYDQFLSLSLIYLAKQYWYTSLSLFSCMNLKPLFAIFDELPTFHLTVCTNIASLFSDKTDSVCFLYCFLSFSSSHPYSTCSPWLSDSFKCLYKSHCNLGLPFVLSFFPSTISLACYFPLLPSLLSSNGTHCCFHFTPLAPSCISSYQDDFILTAGWCHTQKCFPLKLMGTCQILEDWASHLGIPVFLICCVTSALTHSRNMAIALCSFLAKILLPLW